jgi:membrane protein DedA with SNARE-associated domain
MDDVTLHDGTTHALAALDLASQALASGGHGGHHLKIILLVVAVIVVVAIVWIVLAGRARRNRGQQ